MGRFELSCVTARVLESWWAGYLQDSIFVVVFGIDARDLLILNTVRQRSESSPACELGSQRWNCNKKFDKLGICNSFVLSERMTWTCVCSVSSDLWRAGHYKQFPRTMQSELATFRSSAVLILMNYENLWNSPIKSQWCMRRFSNSGLFLLL